MRTLLAALALLLLAAPAQAATVSYRADGCEPDEFGNVRGCFTSVTLAASPGEANRLAVEPRGQAVLFTDAGAPLAAGSGCKQLGERAAECPAAEVVRIDLRDGDDDLRTLGRLNLTLGADGGAGDDRLVAAATALRLTGGPGRDALQGGPGDDRLEGGADTDELDGGDGRDRAVFEGAEPVVVDLADPGGDGPASGLDSLRGIEDVSTGSGDDVLRGDDGPNDLDAGPGQDRLAGAGGPDRLEAGLGFDALDGGPGDDEIAAAPDQPGPLGERDFALDPDREPVDCGTGRDVVIEQRGDVLRGCELVELFGRDLGPRALVAPLRFTRRRAVFRFPCSEPVRRIGCLGELLIARAGENSIARRRIRWRPGQPVRIRLDPIRVPTGAFALQVTLRYRSPREGDADYDTLTYVTPARVR